MWFYVQMWLPYIDSRFDCWVQRSVIYYGAERKASSAIISIPHSGRNDWNGMLRVYLTALPKIEAPALFPFRFRPELLYCPPLLVVAATASESPCAPMAVRELLHKAWKDDLVSEQFCTDTESTHPIFVVWRKERIIKLTRAMTRQLLRGGMTRAGLPRPSTDKTARKYRRMGPSERRVEVPTALKVDGVLVEG
jgi:hypothetical protein